MAPLGISHLWLRAWPRPGRWLSKGIAWGHPCLVGGATSRLGSPLDEAGVIFDWYVRLASSDRTDRRQPAPCTHSALYLHCQRVKERPLYLCTVRTLHATYMLDAGSRRPRPLVQRWPPLVRYLGQTNHIPASACGATLYSMNGGKGSF